MRQAHNLKVAGSNPDPHSQPKFNLPLILDDAVTKTALDFSIFISLNNIM